MKPTYCVMALALALVTGTSETNATDAFYLGSWHIASAVVAPWVPPGMQPDVREMKSLVGKAMIFKSDRIQGPGILACPKLEYVLVESPPEGLFQGAFEEMHRKDPSADPAKLAAGMGFKAASIRTLQTGCANELDFHYIDETAAEFGLNDYVYTIKKD